MKTLLSVVLVCAATAVPAFADSAYFLKPVARSVRTVAPTSNNTTPVITDRVSVRFRPMTTARATSPAKMPMIFVDRRYTRGSAQAGSVR
jgi:hypothetical protein